MKESKNMFWGRVRKGMAAAAARENLQEWLANRNTSGLKPIPDE
ncbi:MULTISPECIES: hypothetical protein [unclassified Cryobacterium]